MAVPAFAKSRDTVAGRTLKSLGASVAVFVPFDTIATISTGWRDDKCLVRSRSRVTGVALEWHHLCYLILEARRLVRGAALKLNNSICPVALHRWNLQSDRPANRVRKTRKASAGLGLVRIPDPPRRRSVGGRKPSFSPPPFLRLRSGSCSTHDVENVFQFSVDPVAMPK